MSIPLKAKRVFKGVIFEVWQWKQKMFDGSTKNFEQLKRPNTTQIIAIIGDKILIQSQRQPQNKKPFISLPGGRCDKKEKPLQAAKRELLEETGYISKNWFLWQQYQPHSKIEYRVYTYIARNCIFKQPPRLDAGEKITNSLINFEKFLKLTEKDSFRIGDLKNIIYRARLDKKKNYLNFFSNINK